MAADHESENAEKDRDAQGRAGVAAQGDPGRDHSDQNREAADAREHTPIAHQRILREILDQLRPDARSSSGLPFSSLARMPLAVPCNVSQALKKTTKGTSAIRLTRAAVPSTPRRSG